MLNYENVFMSKFTLFERLYDTDTKEVIIQKAKYKPVVFTKAKGNKQTEFRYFLDKDVFLEKHTFDDEKEYKDFIKFQEQIGATTYGVMQAPYAHIRDNYYNTQSEFKSRIWYFDIETRVLPDQGFPHPDETPSAINMFQIYDNIMDKIIILADENISKEKLDELKDKYNNLVFRAFGSEVDLINAFIKMIHNLKPCIITAWNGEKFDFPYITNRMTKLGLEPNSLSLTNNASTRVNIDKTTNEKMYQTNWDGIYLLDMMVLYKKFTYVTQSSYSLENVVKVELGSGEGKVDYKQYKNISEFMHKDWDTFTEYGIKDVVLLNQLDKKLNLVELTRMLAYKMGINVDDALGTVKPWATYLYNLAYNDNLIFPNKNESEYSGIAGGWVSNPRKGKHEWIVSFDFASLYPSTMRWNNMSGETIISHDDLHSDLKALKEKIYYLEDIGDGIENDPWSKTERFVDLYIRNSEALRKASNVLKKHNVTCGVNGAFFKKDEIGIIPNIIKQIYSDRKRAKKDMFKHEQELQRSDLSEYDIAENKRLVAFYNTEQMALKILMNSLYGACANKHFVLFSQGMAEAITANGRMINQFCSLKLDDHFKDLGIKDAMIYNDTDSAYFTLKKIIPKELLEQNDKQAITDWCNEYCAGPLQKVIDLALEEVSDLVNAYEPEAQAEDREIIADSGFWVAKKKYVARVLDSEGVRLKEPKMKVMGLEIIRSNTPNFCKKTLKNSIELILDKEEHEIQEYISEIKTKFYNEDIDNVSRVSGISNLNYDLSTSKSIPINSRSGIIHNSMIERAGLTKEFDLITTSDKIKYIFLKVPNPAFNQDVFGYKDSVVIERLGLTKYIDKDKMFEKFFMSPMNIMLEPIGWSGTKQASFDDWDF